MCVCLGIESLYFAFFTHFSMKLFNNTDQQLKRLIPD